MHLVIDGYNLLKKIKGSAYISEKERENFIKKLNNYAHQKKLKLTVVFDGGPYQWAMVSALSNFLDVVYSGVKESADDYIKRFIELHKTTDILLITSDRELIHVARTYAIPSMDSYDFSQVLYALQAPVMQRNKINRQQTHKLTEKEHQELDTLMQTLQVTHKKEVVQEREKKKDQRLSKEERKLLQKIKKL